MKRSAFIILALLILPSLCISQDLNPGILGSSGGAAADGPNVWYWAGTAMSDSAYTEAEGAMSGEIDCDDVAVSVGGSATKVAYRGTTVSLHVKIAVFNTSGTQLNAGCTTGSTISGWNECTLSVPLAVTATTYRVCGIADGFININKLSTGGVCKWQSGVYANFPASYSTLTLSNCGTTGKAYALKMYVD